MRTSETNESDRPRLTVVKATPSAHGDAVVGGQAESQTAPAEDPGILARGVWVGTYFIRPGVRELVAVDSQGVLRVRAEFTTHEEAMHETKRLWRVLDTLDPQPGPTGLHRSIRRAGEPTAGAARRGALRRSAGEPVPPSRTKVDEVG